MKRNDPIDNILKTPSRVITAAYATFRIIIYALFSPEFLLHRIIYGVMVVAVVFIITGSKKLTRRQMSILAPFSIALIELIVVSQVSGDRLVYFVMVGCALVCLTFVDVLGLFIMIALTASATAFFIFVLGVPIMGVQFTFYDDLFNFLGMISIFAIIFTFGKYSIGAFDSFRKTGQTFDRILDMSPNLIVIVNDDARVEYISKSFVEILGIEKREYAANLPFTDLFPSVKFKLFFGKLLRREGTFEETFDFQLDGKQRWFIVRSARIGKGSVARLFECVEITPMVMAQQAAETATRSKSEFLAVMSHEIRTPMNAIIGITQIQLQEGNLPEKYAAALEKIYASGSSLLGIINDILDMSKIETGKMQLNAAEYDVPNLINDAVQLNIVRIGSKRIEFSLDINENMPSRLYGDEIRIKQILNNLLSNAFKYTEEGRVKLSVNHFFWGNDLMLRFVVEDTGQGMRKEDKDLLFSEYTRFNAGANRAIEGTGLGLNITRKLIEMMDGTIIVESEYGRGSTFTVTVKQKMVNCPTIGAKTSERLLNFTYNSDRQAAKTQITREPMPYGNVLVVDDVEANLFVAEGLLSLYKLKIETADSGFAAIEKVQGGGVYDIIFMDHMMPKMDGIETTGKLREMGYKGAIVALTANVLAGNHEMFLKNGFDGYIPKPIDVRHLNSVLHKFVRDRHPEEAAAAANESSATANGSSATANGSSATANGSGATVNGSSATANGSGATANGSGATANGSGATANESSATANGSGATARESSATANGSGAAARESSAAAHGSDATARESSAAVRESSAAAHGSGATAHESGATAHESDEMRAKLLRVFRRDAEKAVATLRETTPHIGDAGGDIKLFTTTAHAMKSALAIVGEAEKSQLAAALEKAGLNGDVGFIAANTGNFIKLLESLVRDLSPVKTDGADVTEDTAYLAEQLQIIKTACDDYDDTSAYAALDRLKEKPWKHGTAAALEKIRDTLFLRSDFEEAGDLAGKILENGIDGINEGSGS